MIKEEDFDEGVLLKTNIYQNSNIIIQSIYDNGILKSEGMLINNKKEGEWKFFNEDTFLIKEIIYEDDKLKEVIEYELPDFE